MSDSEGLFTHRTSTRVDVRHRTQKSKLVWFLRRFRCNMPHDGIMCHVVCDENAEYLHIVCLPCNFHRCIMPHVDMRSTRGMIRRFWCAVCQWALTNTETLACQHVVSSGSTHTAAPCWWFLSQSQSLPSLRCDLGRCKPGASQLVEAEDGMMKTQSSCSVDYLHTSPAPPAQHDGASGSKNCTAQTNTTRWNITSSCNDKRVPQNVLTTNHSRQT